MEVRARIHRQKKEERERESKKMEKLRKCLRLKRLCEEKMEWEDRTE